MDSIRMQLKKPIKYWPGGYYLVSNTESTFPGDRPLIGIGYKYTTWKVIYFVATEDTWSIEYGITNIYKYINHLNNILVISVACLIVISKLFGYINVVDPHNKLRQYDSDMEITGLLRVFRYGYEHHFIC